MDSVTVIVDDLEQGVIVRVVEGGIKGASGDQGIQGVQGEKGLDGFLSVNGVIESGNANAVSGGNVYDLNEIEIIRNHKPTSYKNIYDINAIQYNKYINPANGLIQTLENAIVSDYIPIIDTNQDVITSVVDLGLTSFRTITFLDADKTTVLGWSFYNGGVISNTNCNVEWFENGWKINAYPVGADYCVFQVRKNVTTTTWETADIQFENGVVRTAYDDRSPFANTQDFKIVEESVENITPFIRTSFTNLYYAENVQLNKYIRTTDGVILALTNGIISDYISVDASKSYVFTSEVNLGLTIFGSITFLASDKTTVLGFGVYNNTTGLLDTTSCTAEYYSNGIKITTLPIGAVYMVVQIRRNDTSITWETAKIQIEEGLVRTYYDDKSSFISYERGKEIDSRDYGNWFLKRYASFGTSITWYDGNGRIGYQQELIKRNGIISYVNKGVSGETIAFYTGSTNDLVSDITTYDFSLYDLITIEHGTNDFGLDIPIGLIDSVNNNDFYGAFNLVLTEIFTQNVNIRIVLLTPFQRAGQNSETSANNTAGHNLKDYADAIKIIGSKWGCPIIDNFSNSGINSLTIPTYLADGLHPNNDGFDFVGKYIGRKINNL